MSSLLVSFLLVAGQIGAVDDRPNILVVIADDWSWPHPGIPTGAVSRTPNFDRLAARGVLFTRAFCAAPSCTPSRAAMLTGRWPHTLGPGANLWGVLPAQYSTYPDLLAWSGYAIGQSGKGWGPGTLDASGRTHNPAGLTFANFAAFLKTAPTDRPFCFWHGSQDPHRPYDKGTGLKAGFDPKAMQIPGCWPDTEVVREDVLDYDFEVRRFDETLAAMLKTLEESGRASNTIVVVTSDNGMPFPRAKANLYDAGTRVPLAIAWPKGINTPRQVDAPVSLADLAPTFLEIARVKPDPGLDGKSLVPFLRDGTAPGWRTSMVTERERHADVREGHLGYPARALRTSSHLYIRNYAPDRWPAGDPQARFSVGPFGDIDGSPTKDLLINGLMSNDIITRYSQLALAKRPAEELYDVRTDPAQVVNLADEKSHANTLKSLRDELDQWMRATHDPRIDATGAAFDRYPYVGPGLKDRPARPRPTPDNTLTDLEKTLGWRLLFDGKTTEGWTTDKGQAPRTPVDNAALNPHGAGGYMLVHKEQAGDFILTLDFQITPGCNSGVFLRTSPLEPRPGKDVGFNGIEIAIDDTTTAGFHDTGAIYDLVKPSQNAMKRVGEWNHLVIIADGPTIAVESNGKLVSRMNLDEWTTKNQRPDGTSHKFDVAYRDHPRRGYIGLQDHGKPCRFKNIKLMPIR